MPIPKAMLALALLSACTSGPRGDPGPAGPKGDTGAAGPQGVAGPAGSKGDQGAAGTPGPAGPLVVLSSEDGGSVFIDGGVAIVAGPQGATGATGVAGPIGASGTDGPTGAPGPAGPAGPPGATGPSAGVLVMGVDGGVQGILAGRIYFDRQAHCGMDVSSGGPPVQLCWTNPDCTGTPYVQGLNYNDGTLTSPSLVGLCFFGNGNQSLGGWFRLAEPIQRVPAQLWSCYRYNQSICDLRTTPLASAYPIVRLSLPVPSFPPDDGFSLQFQ